ncbi:hypothetical protein GIB67_036822 [Kingdonia uniflora]|uniref:Increased DNA methylation 1 C-terminal domain-containing protein n=1 Tax=Kingdonia uniflora TaxID=39325 RepID=A0A7J7LWU6_9MAGN|nr:hypothetical protein GIB67_036822 [Kingdonia uniflora]
MEDQPMLDDSRCSNRDSFVIDIQREGSSISHPSSSRCVYKTLCTNVDEIRFSKLYLLNFTNKPTTTTLTSFIVWVRHKSNDYYFVSDIDGSLVVKRYGRIGFPIRNMWLWSISHGVIFLQRSNSRYLGSLTMGKYVQVLELDPSKTGCYSFGMGFSVSTKELKVVQVLIHIEEKQRNNQNHILKYLCSCVVSTGIIRISGVEVAEIPIVATINDCQGKGYFQALFACMEIFLGFLNVRNIVLPAADEVGLIWTDKFGFNRMTHEQLHGDNIFYFRLFGAGISYFSWSGAGISYFTSDYLFIDNVDVDTTDRTIQKKFQGGLVAVVREVRIFNEAKDAFNKEVQLLMQLHHQLL